jgi:hypothetical protein
MMRITLINLIAITIILAGCGKEASFEANQGGNTGGNGGGNNGGSQGNSDSYQPTSANSYWHYKETGDFISESTITSTGQHSTISGIDFVLFNSTSPQSTGNVQSYMGTKDHNFYFLDQGNSPNSGASFDLNFLYLNDTASVGYTWDNNAGQGNGFTAHTPGKIMERGITLTVAGKSYNNVIHTQENLTYDIPGFGTLNSATYDYYVAKGVGIIRVLAAVGDASVTGTVVHTTTDLVDYSIK